MQKQTANRKDTVAADEENDKVNAHHHVGEDGPSISHNAIVHDSIPVFSGQNLCAQKEELKSIPGISTSRSHVGEKKHRSVVVTFKWNHLEASEQSLGERVKGASLHLSLIEVEFAPKQLHAQQGKDDEKEEEQEQKGADGFHGVEQ